MAPAAWRLYSVWCLAPGAWCLVPGARCLVWCEIFGPDMRDALACMLARCSRPDMRDALAQTCETLSLVCCWRDALAQTCETLSFNVTAGVIRQIWASLGRLSTHFYILFSKQASVDMNSSSGLGPQTLRSPLAQAAAITCAPAAAEKQ